MEQDELVSHLRRLLAKIRADDSIYGTHSEVCEFLRIHTNPKNAFLQAISKFDPHKINVEYAAKSISQNLIALVDSIEAGVHEGLSPQRQAELDVVSDFLGMANLLLETPGVHPAAPAVLIGATLEEFLRTWVEAENIPLGNKKQGLETYS